MKKTLLFLFFILALNFSYSQVRLITNKITPVSNLKSDIKSSKQFGQTVSNKKDYVIPSLTKIGLSNYDLQTNGSVAKRLINHSDGTISAVWIQYQGKNTSAPERGTGYAYFDGSQWNFVEQSGNETVEGSTRTGWPAIMSNGTEEFVVSHVTSDHGLYGHYQTKGVSGSNWAENNVADGTEEPMLWPRAASAGDNYYVIAVDNYDDNAGNIIEGVHFYKSTDAGQNWTYNGQLRHFKTYYLNASGDDYAIDARDNYVAIVYFGAFADTRLWKSDDYGASWTETVINDFPQDKYDPTVGPIIDCNKDGKADIIVSTDNTGDVIIDSQGKVHVVFSQMVYTDSEIEANGSSSYYPSTDYLLYWNEDMGGSVFDSTTTLLSPNKYGLSSKLIDTIGSVPDYNRNGLKDFFYTNSNSFPFGMYSRALTSMASLGIDADDNIYVAYSTVMEGNLYKRKKTYNSESQQYRAIFLRRRDAISGHWGKPTDISSIDGKKKENVFPCVARLVDSKVHVMYQEDAEPGLAMGADQDLITDNYIVYKEIGIDTLTGIKNLNSNTNFNLYPNPASKYVVVSDCDKSVIEIYNSLGQQVLNIKATSNNQRIDLSGLYDGTFIIKVISENGISTKKFVHIK